MDADWVVEGVMQWLRREIEVLNLEASYEKDSKDAQATAVLKATERLERYMASDDRLDRVDAEYIDVLTEVIASATTVASHAYERGLLEGRDRALREAEQQVHGLNRLCNP